MTFGVADLCSLIINIFILTPIGLYYTVQYYQRYKRGDNIILLRRPRLVLFILFSSLYYISIHQPIYILLLSFLSSNNNYKWEFIFDTLGYQIIFILYFWRAWHQYFAYQEGRIKADHIWKKVINENYDHIQYENKLFIKYSETLGNPKFTIYIISTYIIIYLFIIILTTYLNSLYIAQYIAVIDILIIIIPFIFLFYNISSVYDTIYIHKEILIQSIVILVILLTEIILIFTLNNQNNNNAYMIHIELLLESILPSICFFINILMSTAYVFHMQIKENNLYQTYKNSIQPKNKHSSNSLPSSISTLFTKFSHSLTDTNTATNTNNTSGKTNNNSLTLSSQRAYIGHVDLIKLLQQKEGFKLFVDHCVKEYGLENLLCIIEINQFKQYCIEQINEDEDGIENKGEFISDLIEFYPSVPQSKIVENINMNVKDKYICLYEKYIDSGKASLEVNISALSRKHLLKQYRRLNNQRLIKKSQECNTSKERKDSLHSSSRFDYDSIQNNEIYQIIKSFNGAIKDVIKCLNDSYSRFHITKEYKKWHQQYVINGKLNLKGKINKDNVKGNSDKSGGENNNENNKEIELQIVQ